MYLNDSISLWVLGLCLAPYYYDFRLVIHNRLPVHYVQNSLTNMRCEDFFVILLVIYKNPLFCSGWQERMNIVVMY